MKVYISKFHLHIRVYNNVVDWNVTWISQIAKLQCNNSTKDFPNIPSYDDS